MKLLLVFALMIFWVTGALIWSIGLYVVLRASIAVAMQSDWYYSVSQTLHKIKEWCNAMYRMWRN